MDAVLKEALEIVRQRSNQVELADIAPIAKPLMERMFRLTDGNRTSAELLGWDMDAKRAELKTVCAELDTVKTEIERLKTEKKQVILDTDKVVKAAFERENMKMAEVVKARKQLDDDMAAFDKRKYMLERVPA